MLGPLQPLFSPPNLRAGCGLGGSLWPQDLKQEGNMMGCMGWRDGPRASFMAQE